MLSVKHLTAGYGKSQVLFDVSFDLGPGEMICLLGRNGMGKTTTVRAIMGIMPAWGGSITLERTEIAGMASARIARLGMGLVPEGRQIFPNLTTHENLIVAAAPNRHGAPTTWTCDAVYELFPALRDRRHSFGNLLSGGEQQMLAIGRALMTNPRVLILDEATEGLAPLIRGHIWDCLAKLRAAGQSVIIIDKYLQRLLTLVDRFYVVEKGRTVWTASAGEAQRDVERLKRCIAV